MGKGPAWITFEEECWGKAMEDFRSGVKSDDKELAEKFLKTNSTLSDARDACKTVECDTDARYSAKDSPSITIGGVKIKPKALFVKLLNNLDTFIMMGDVAVKGGPESVGLVWMGLKMGLQAINADYETCGIITSCFVDIVGVFISCRMYAQLYGPALFQNDLAEVQDRVRQEIPSMLCDILNFSFSASKFIHQGEVKRWAKAFLKAFKDTKGKFEVKAKSIRDHHAKLVAHAEQAAQQETILRGRADSEDLMKIIKTLNDLSTQLEAERKTLRKSFQEAQQDIFEQKSKGLNPSVDSESLQARNIKKRAPGTCQWIFDKVDKYNEWRQSAKSEMLWLSGEAGFGKSILLATVVERLQTEFEDSNDTLIHYFYCRTGNDNTQLGSNILGNILFQLYRASTNSPQLLEQCNNLFKDDDKQVRTVNKAQTSQSGATDHAAMYIKMGGIIRKTIYLVIDALDECSDGVVEVCNKLQSLLGGENFTLKLLVSSRPDLSITAALEGACEEIQMKEYNGPDIELKVRKELINIPGLSNSEQEYAIDKITKKAEGEFSYVDTAINILREPWRRTAGRQRSLEDVLENLPPGMHGSYDLMFKQVSPTYVELTKTFLNWALLTEGEITVQEVMDDYNDAFSNSIYIPYSSEKSQQETLADQLDRAVGRFLEIDRKSEPWTIKLRHASVKDYFLEDNAPEHQESANSLLCLCAKCGVDMQENVHFKVYKREGHLEMAVTLLRHLNSTLFQRVFLDMEDGVSNDSGDSDDSESGNDGKESEDDNPEEQRGVDKMNISESQSDLADAKALDNSTDTKGGNEAAEHEAGDQDLSEEVEASGDQPSENEEPPIEEPDYEGDFQDLEDDYELQELQDSEEITETSDSSTRLRYEMTHWIYHLREAENRWSPSEREVNPRWKELWDQLEKFILSDAFKKWKLTGWDNGDLDQIGSQWLYRGDKLQPLHVAAGLGLAGTTEEFIRRGYDVNQPSSYGEVPLHFAAKLQNVNIDLLQSLLANGANPDYVPLKDIVEEAVVSSSPFLILLEYNPTAEAVKLFIDYGANCVEPENTQIQTFALWGSETIVFEMLVEHGADVNAVDGFGETSLHHLLGRSWHPPVDLVQSFLKHGARLDIDDRNSQQPLYEVARSGNIEAARVILNHEPGPDLVDLDYLKMTAIHIAAWWGHNEIITLLNEKGAPLNEQDGFGRTPLMLACLGNEPDTALLLLDYLSEHSFQTVNVPDRNGKTPFRKAARHGLVNVLQKFLTLSGAESFINDSDNVKSTALHVAAYNGHDVIVKLLLEKGADPLLPDGQGRNALTICKEGWVRGSKESSEKALLLLIEKVPEQAVKDESILYAAARTGSLDVIKSLLDHHADVNQKDGHGWSTLTIARQYGHQEVCDYLEQKGVEINTQPTRFVGGTERLQISEDGLRLESMGLDSIRTCVFSDHPIPAGAAKFYYEVTIEAEPETKDNPPVVGIGLSTKPVNTRDRMPGWWSPRAPWWGFHSDDGKLFHFKGRSYENIGYRPFSYGDTVGCGFDASKREVFYTINGEQLGLAFDDVRGQLFPVIGIRDKSAVRVNFGASDFQWKEAGNFLSSSLVGGALMPRERQGVSRNNLNHEVRGSLIAHILLFPLMFDILVGSTSVGIVNNIRDWRHHNTFGLGLDEENYIMNLAPEPVEMLRRMVLQLRKA